MTAFCQECDNEIPGGDLCQGCRNEAAGLCRWCGQRSPASDSALCSSCDEAGDIAVEVGTFSGAAAVLQMRVDLSRLPTATTPSRDTGRDTGHDTGNATGSGPATM